MATPAKVGQVVITHPDRVIDAVSKSTKLDLARYYEAVLPWLLRYADHRPLTLVRSPDGLDGEVFFQKRKFWNFPSVVKTARAVDQQAIYVEDATGLLSVIQFNAVELHVWGGRFPYPQKPDWIVMDLDPDEGLAFSQVVRAARHVKDVLARLHLECFVKTTGGRGLHVVAPVVPDRDWATARAVTESIAHHLVKERPKLYTVNASKEARAGKIFLDYLRNTKGSTTVLPYSARARPGLTVALPVAWDELDAVDPRTLTTRSVPDLVKRRAKDPWAKFFSIEQELPRIP
jgi:bifunctional non-homologous end joining protein LigD